MADRFLVSIDYPDGNRLARRVEAISAEDRAICDEIVGPQVDALAAEMGLPRHVVMAELAAYVIELEHEEAMYERACARKGLLAL